MHAKTRVTCTLACNFVSLHYRLTKVSLVTPSIAHSLNTTTYANKMRMIHPLSLYSNPKCCLIYVETCKSRSKTVSVC